MRKGFLVVAITGLFVWALAGTATAAGSSSVVHVSDGPFQVHICGVLATATSHGTSLSRDKGDAGFFGHFAVWEVFEGRDGRSVTLFQAGTFTGTSPPVIDPRAGTVTIVQTLHGLQERLSITRVGH